MNMESVLFKSTLVSLRKGIQMNYTSDTFFSVSSIKLQNLLELADVMSFYFTMVLDGQVG